MFIKDFKKPKYIILSGSSLTARQQVSKTGFPLQIPCFFSIDSTISLEMQIVVL